MAVISETSEDKNGGDQNSNKKLKNVQKDQFFLIPDGVTEACLAFIPRCRYPDLSLVSKTFHRFIASPSLYDARLRLRCTEPVLYVCMGFTRFRSPSWYILHRKPYRNLPNTVSLRLEEIDSLPPMPWGSAVVTIGYEMYVIGGCVGQEPTRDVILIDCRFHTYRYLPSMRVARRRAAAGVFGGKIFVLGGCEMRDEDWLETFDLEDKLWTRCKWSPQPDVSSEFVTYAEMDNKTYVLGERKCYAYDPRARGVIGGGVSWQKLVVGDFMSVLWQESSCVIDGLLFSINPQRVLGNFVHLIGYPIIVCDPKEKNWRPLNGLQGFPAKILLDESKMANFGGKLVILGTDESWFTEHKGKKEIWCIEIALERRQRGEISGKVESVAVVLTVPRSPATIEFCRTVTV